MKKLRIALLIAAIAVIAVLVAVRFLLVDLDWVRRWMESAGYSLAALLLLVWGILTAIRAKRKLLKAALALLCALLVWVGIESLWIAYHDINAL